MCPFALLPRDRLDPSQDGEAVRAFDRRSGDFLAEGTWEARTDQPDGSYVAVLHTGDQGVFSVPGGVRTEVTDALPRARPRILTEPQLAVAAELLLELAAVYRGEPMGALADEVARTITGGLGVELDGQGCCRRRACAGSDVPGDVVAS